MTKVISYSLFRDCRDFEWNFYLRGLYFNLRMNRLLYPDWEVRVHAEPLTIPLFFSYAPWQKPAIAHEFTKASRCESMLWRLKPLWEPGVTHVICRDADAITTYREMQSVNRWLISNRDAHGMNDNPAHGGLYLMGGMCGFRSEPIVRRYPTWDNLIENYDLSQHGSDQQLLMDRVYPIVKDSFYFDREPQLYHDNPLWESDLTCRHIGSAGVVEMELLRFFHRHDPDNEKFVEFEKEHSDLFYWRK